MCLTESAAPFRTEQTQRERERERRERERGCVRALGKRETLRSRGSHLQMHYIYICYKQDTQEARSTPTRRRLSWQ